MKVFEFKIILVTENDVNEKLITEKIINNNKYIDEEMSYTFNYRTNTGIKLIKIKTIKNLINFSKDAFIEKEYNWLIKSQNIINKILKVKNK